jgi:hypothetical protein
MHCALLLLLLLQLLSFLFTLLLLLLMGHCNRSCCCTHEQGGRSLQVQWGLDEQHSSRGSSSSRAECSGPVYPLICKKLQQGSTARQGCAGLLYAQAAATTSHDCLAMR